MRSYKSIERPAQVLGMNIQDLGIMVGLGIGSVLLLGFLSMAVKIPRIVYLLVILVEVGLLMGLRYLSKKQAPGFLMGWLSFTFIQPRRLTVGPLPIPAHAKKTKNGRV